MQKIRIIPTRVGTSLKQQKLRHKERDHPHACGDKVLYDRWAVGYTGSSPRVWGQVISSRLSRETHRIIPTRVGTSCIGHFCNIYIKDHPHACGDKAVENPYFHAGIGSSPRVWGQVCLYNAFAIWSKDHPHACGDKLLAM